jgi:hypothetical protein
VNPNLVSQASSNVMRFLKTSITQKINKDKYKFLQNAPVIALSSPEDIYERLFRDSENMEEIDLLYKSKNLSSIYICPSPSEGNVMGFERMDFASQAGVNLINCMQLYFSEVDVKMLDCMTEDACEPVLVS